MEEENKLPKVGDVIVSSKFAFGYYNNKDHKDKKLITVDGKTKRYPITSSLSEEERVNIAAKNGIIPPKAKTEEFGAYDLSRATAKFVVEEAKWQGGGYGHASYYPDGWHIEARRLDKGRKYNPEGEIISFYMTGFTCRIEAKNVKIVGKMQKIFI